MVICSRPAGRGTLPSRQGKASPVSARWPVQSHQPASRGETQARKAGHYSQRGMDIKGGARRCLPLPLHPTMCTCVEIRHEGPGHLCMVLLSPQRPLPPRPSASAFLTSGTPQPQILAELAPPKSGSEQGQFFKHRGFPAASELPRICLAGLRRHSHPEWTGPRREACCASSTCMCSQLRA